MEKIKEIIRTLKKEQVKLVLNGDNIEVVSYNNKLTPEQINLIKTNKEDIISYLKGMDTNDEVEQIPALEEANNYRLSDAQKRMWIICQLESSSVAYNMPLQMPLDGEYDIDTFKRAIDATIDRHEILRTVFKEDENGEVRQWILDRETLGFEVNQFELQNESNPEAVAKQLIEDDTYQPFDLSNGPLLRASIFQIAANKYIFYYNMHHIISDGWSLNVLANDVMHYYTSFMSNSTPTLPELRVHYKDYSAWRASTQENGGDAKDKAYWTEKLGGELTLLDLPRQSQRPKYKTNNGNSLQTYLSADIAAKLNAYNQQAQGSLFIGILSTLNVLLQKYTNKKDIIIGSPIVGRDHPDLQNQIGFYVNSLVLRNQVDTEKTFTNFYNEVRENVFESFKYKSYPFDRLVEDLNVPYDMSRTPIFDISLTLHETIRGLDTNTCLDEITERTGTVSKNDIEFHFQQIEDVILFKINYNSDLYDSKTLQLFMKHFKQLITNILENPNTPIDELHYLNQEEQQQLIYDFNAITLDYDRNATLLTEFDKQVESKPDVPALVFNNTTLTYKELDALSNKLARCLIKEYEVKKGDFVGIHLDRSEMVLVSMMAILKAGAAYVPIDPAYPEDRKEYMTTDSNISLLISSTNYMFDLDFFEGIVFSIDVEFEADEFSAAALDINVQPTDGAYIIYTSGSTGKPKGVLVPHKGIVNTALACINTMYYGECKKSLQFASFSFDASAFETFNALLAGSSLYIADERERKTPEFLTAFIEENAIESATLPPSYFKFMDTDRLNSLKVLITAGEPPVLEQVKKFLANGGIFFNAYGPTETSVCSSAFKMTSESNTDTNIPIGFPIPNAQMYVLDENNNLVAPGIIGEICIGGLGLADGYLNREQLTAEKFINNPFRTGERLYKTGDLGILLPNGTIEFQGRKDDQVKIRGHRIELGEISARLEAKEDIEEVVLLVNEEEDEKLLAAYIVASKTQKITELRQYLLQTLPEYMVPNHFIQVGAIPLTVNGKVDKKTLLRLGSNKVTDEKEYVAPRNDIEKRISEIWAKSLNVEKVSVEDDFFLLGGQSLKATALISTYEREFQVRISLKQLFENTTLEAHSKLIEDGRKETFTNIPTVSEAESYAISDAQRRLWVLSRFDGASVAYNIPFSMRLNIEDVASFRKAIFTAIERHEMLRTIFKKDASGEVRQWVVPTNELNFTIQEEDFRSQDNSAEAVQNYITQDAYKPFDLENGPLLRASLLQVAEAEYVFYCNMHHIISDGWSMDVLMKDVNTYYETLRNGEEVTQEALSIQYKDYAAWHLDQIEGEAYAKERKYWANKLRGTIPAINLPSQRQRPQIKTYNGRTLKTNINAETTEAIRDFIAENGGSLFTFALAGFNAMIHRYTGEKDITIGTPVAGRNHADLQNQIGFYVNTLALRNSVTSEEDFETFYNRVKVDTIADLDNQMYPFDRLVEDLESTIDTSRNAIFDIMLIVQNIGDIKQEVESVSTAAIQDLGVTRAKFDLSLTLEERVDTIEMHITFNTDVYEQSLVEQFVMHFTEMLSVVTTAPSLPIGTFDFLREEDTLQLAAFNETEVAYSEANTIVELFAAQVQATPDKTALVFEGESLTYRELDEKSNQLANYIRTLSLDNNLIPICVDRSLEMLIGIWAVLKSGNAYVPIDPAYPQSRIDYILNDIQANYILTNAASNNVTLENVERVELDNFTYNVYSKDAVNVNIDENTLAYCIYTSGTTGNPKGVLNAHAGLRNRILWMRDELAVDDNAVLLQKTPYVFDVSVWELTMPFITGATLVVALPGGHMDPEYLQNTIQEQNVSLVHFVPSMLNIFIDVAKAEKLANLNYIVCSGEALSSTTVEKTKALLPNVQLYNYYGPTEAAIDVTSINLTDINTAEEGVSIGRPVANTQLYIVNDMMNLQPVGVVGELLIGGIQVAKGYMNKTLLTAEKFIENPFEAEGNVYKTGDLVRWLPNGTIEFIGRKDNQVKIRGNRIELGAVENQLLRKDSIQEAVVNVYTDAKEEKQLVAYVVSTIEENITDVRTHLAASLPLYMLPEAFVQLDAMPLTVNGKVDRKALPDPVGNSLQVTTVYEAPTNEMQSTLVSLIANELGREEDAIGVADNFFDLGINSMKLLRILEFFNTKYSLSVAPVAMFQYPNIKSFVSSLDNSNEATKVVAKEEENLSEAVDELIDLL
ncbi:non-ribosomal peptide synthetase [Kordia sp.]|uniref:non-ribosomal peptide synthetase n=1 Tax=Kordia sp. TaxID=1965332 RepID=UPI0025BE191B|nr:non-ribosomal peptide synthetase [Kordia sp.]MCH2195459.1 amino acid adenylation domain-containing protein [Kordia sp.]